MSFASITFIFVFLPLTLALYYLFPKGNWRLAILVLSSLAFFAWIDVIHMPVLLLFVLLNYGFGLLIGRFQGSDKINVRRVWMWSGISVNLMFLVYYKYIGFFSDFLSSLSQGQGNFKDQALFLGISYVTFSGISYILDVYKNSKPAENNFLKLASYLIMFPKLIQGPITLFREIEPQLAQPSFSVGDIRWGIRRFITGLAKKILLADTLVVAANRVFAAPYASLLPGAAWMGLIAYSLVIYFDFSGYTDMAVGIGRMFGYRLPENFKHPYTSRSIVDFWRRWHMSLTHWFRTYIFIPLEYARRREKFLRQQSNILIVFFLTGLWHGASWNFVIWGIYFGVVLAMEARGFGKKLKKAPLVFQHVYTLVIVIFGWVLFRITDTAQWGPFLNALIGTNSANRVETLRSLNLLFYTPVILFGSLISLPFPAKVRRLDSINQATKEILFDILLVGVFLLSIAAVLSNGFRAFMYAKF